MKFVPFQVCNLNLNFVLDLHSNHWALQRYSSDALKHTISSHMKCECTNSISIWTLPKVSSSWSHRNWAAAFWKSMKAHLCVPMLTGNGMMEMGLESDREEDEICTFTHKCFVKLRITIKLVSTKSVLPFENPRNITYLASALLNMSVSSFFNLFFCHKWTGISLQRQIVQSVPATSMSSS